MHERRPFSKQSVSRRRQAMFQKWNSRHGPMTGCQAMPQARAPLADPRRSIFMFRSGQILVISRGSLLGKTGLEKSRKPLDFLAFWRKTCVSRGQFDTLYIWPPLWTLFDHMRLPEPTNTSRFPKHSWHYCWPPNYFSVHP